MAYLQYFPFANSMGTRQVLDLAKNGRFVSTARIQGRHWRSLKVDGEGSGSLRWRPVNSAERYRIIKHNNGVEANRKWQECTRSSNFLLCCHKLRKRPVRDFATSQLVKASQSVKRESVAATRQWRQKWRETASSRRVKRRERAGASRFRSAASQ